MLIAQLTDIVEERTSLALWNTKEQKVDNNIEGRLEMIIPFAMSLEFFMSGLPLSISCGGNMERHVDTGKVVRRRLQMCRIDFLSYQLCTGTCVMSSLATSCKVENRELAPDSTGSKGFSRNSCRNG
ncbi:hypothetical protein C0J52_11104 [Blattella germanica]|nr:hypothetical protein C0J52_11104 [Blattella germanica]